MKVPTDLSKLAPCVPFLIGLATLTILGARKENLWYDEIVYLGGSLLLGGRIQVQAFDASRFSPLFWWVNGVLLYWGIDAGMLRLVNPFYGALCVLATYYLCKECFDSVAAFFSALLLSASWFLWWTSLLFTPDALGTLLLLLSLIFFSKGAKGLRTWMFPAGIASGLAILARDYNVLLLLGVPTFALLQLTCRRQLGFWIGGLGLFLAGFLPLFLLYWWNDFTTYGRLFGRAIYAYAGHQGPYTIAYTLFWVPHIPLYVSVPVVVLAILGFLLVVMRKRGRYLVPYLVGASLYFATMVLAPRPMEVAVEERYFLPILPLFFILGGLSLSDLRKRLGIRALAGIMSVSMLCLQVVQPVPGLRLTDLSFKPVTFAIQHVLWIHGVHGDISFSSLVSRANSYSTGLFIFWSTESQIVWSIIAATSLTLAAIMLLLWIFFKDLFSAGRSENDSSPSVRDRRGVGG